MSENLSRKRGKPMSIYSIEKDIRELTTNSLLTIFANELLRRKLEKEQELKELQDFVKKTELIGEVNQ